MRHAIAMLAGLAALLAAMTARADEIGSVTSPSGVEVQASLEGGDRLAVAILPTNGVLLNGRLGVSFEATGAPGAWADELPRLVLGPGDYFDGPVFESLALAADGSGAPASVAVTFGSCLPVTGICILEETEITVSRGSDGGLSVGLAMLEP